MEASVDGVDLNKLLVEHYGSTKWKFKQMEGWADLSFHAVNASGEEFTFKIFKHFITSEIKQIDAEIELITFLNSKGLPVPSVVPTLTGKTYGEALFGETTRRFRLLTFIKGKIVDRGYNENICRQYGQVTGLLDEALASFRHPFFDDNDQSNFLMQCWHHDIRQQIEKLPAPARKVARRYVEAYDEVIGPNSEHLPKQIIHGDLHGRNLVVNEEGSQVCGAIDFADAMLAFRVLEPSVAVANIFLGDCDHFRCVRAFLEQYVEHAPLNEAELAALPIAVAGRLVMMKTIFNELALTDPSYDRNSFYEFVNAPAWYLVERFLDKEGSHRKLFDDFAESQKKRK